MLAFYERETSVMSRVFMLKNRRKYKNTYFFGKFPFVFRKYKERQKDLLFKERIKK